MPVDKKILITGGNTGVAGASSPAEVDAYFQANQNGIKDSEEWALIQAMKDEARRMMSGDGVPNARDIYEPMQTSINQQAFNLAGAQAADLAKRGLSRSGFQTGSIQNVERQRASSLADASVQADQQARGMMTEQKQQGARDLLNVFNYEQSREALELAKKQRQEALNTYTGAGPK